MDPSRSEATTEGIRVEVRSQYSPERSHPMMSFYFFVYSITISNQRDEPVQLKSRHWVITDAQQHVEEVRGPGVVGETPVLAPGEQFSYASFCILRTPFGNMQGSYQMVRPSGDTFDVEVAPFLLSMPHAVN